MKTSAASSAAFAEEVATPTPQDTFPPVLYVAASTRVLEARRRALLSDSSTGIVLGHHFVTFRGLAERCIAETDTEVRGILEGPALSRVVRNCALGPGPLGRLVEAQPRIAGALASTLRDLRDACVEPTELPDGFENLSRLYRRTEEVHRRLEQEQGLYDRIGLFRLARRGVSAWAGRLGFRRAEVHGATELVGSAGDLLEALAQCVPLRFYQPDAEHPHAAAVRNRWSWSFGPEPTPVAPRPAVPLVGAVPLVAAVPDRALRLLEPHGGPLEELERVAAAVLGLLDDHTAPAEIAVVARTLEPYATWIPAIFERYGIPFRSSLREPALLTPDARALLHLARALLGNLDREPIVELLGSRRFRWEAASKGIERRRLPELAERLGRRAGVLDGLDDWLWAIGRARDLLRDEGITLSEPEQTHLRDVLQALAADSERARRARTFSEVVRRILDAGDRWLPIPSGETSEGARALEAARDGLSSLALLDSVDRVSGGTAPADPREALRAVEEALRGAYVQPHTDPDGGVLVLDAVQARALPLRHLFLIGLNDSLWPQRLEEDPFLPDRVRLQLRDELCRPVPSRGESEQEERFLLDLLVSQATDTVTLSSHEFDATGRPAAPSCYLRGLASRAIPATVEGDLVPLPEALVRAALHGGGEALGKLTDEAPPELAESLERGLPYVSIVEDFDGSDLRYDGAAELDASPLRWSPTHLERIGLCPLRAFFSQVLGVPELGARVQTELEARELGELIHKALQETYTALESEGLLRPGTATDRSSQRAHEKLAEILGSYLPLTEAMARRHPTLWEGLRSQLLRALEAFVDWDLDRLLPEGVEEVACEHRFEHAYRVDSEPILIVGKIDRLLRTPAGILRIADYKSGSTPEGSTAKVAIQRGRSLQLPLYLVITGEQRSAADVEAEILHTPVRPERFRWRRAAWSYPLGWSSVEEVREQIRRAILTLVTLVREGRYPFRRDSHCRSCPYTLACRREHPPTRTRIEKAEAFADYRTLAGGAP